MTEKEWLRCGKPTEMLAHLQGQVSDRKLRLFACACLRQLWRKMTDARSRRAVEVGERFADGLAGQGELAPARTAARQVRYGGSVNLSYSAGYCCAPDMSDAVVGAWQVCVNLASPEVKLLAPTMAALVREVAGNPFRPASLDPALRTPLAASLAQAAYEKRTLPRGELDPARLAVLSDALEEAGCTDEELLAHLRSPGPHVRGCWALDLVLGKG